MCVTQIHSKWRHHQLQELVQCLYFCCFLCLRSVSGVRPSVRRLLPRVSARNANETRDEHGTSEVLHPSRRRPYVVPGYTRTFGNLPMSSSIKTNWYPADIQACQVRNVLAPEHLVCSLVDNDESPLSRTFTDFQQLARRLISQGIPTSQVVDQGSVDVTLFFRKRLPEDPVNASTWASEMLRTFRGVLADDLLLACALCTATLMRWWIMPTADNYLNIPDMVRPTRLQKCKPHPAWMDLMVFPSFRDALILKERDWVGPSTRADWRVTWSGSIEAAIVHDHSTRRTLLHPSFASHVADVRNWTMKTSILNHFPELAGSEVRLVAD
jgi:hypothetical protein